MYRIAVAEDDEADLSRIESFLQRLMKEENISLRYDVFRNGSQLVFSYTPVYDVLLLDIEMPETDGLTAARRIRETDGRVIILFVTSMAQYALQGYQVRARSYLLKPLNYVGFTMELRDALRAVPPVEDDAFLIKTEDGIRRVFASELMYVESRKHQLLFHTQSEVISCRATLSEYEQKLAPRHFIRSSVSYLVNPAWVTGIEKDMAVVGTDQVPISRQRRKEFTDALIRSMGGGSSC